MTRGFEEARQRFDMHGWSAVSDWEHLALLLSRRRRGAGRLAKTLVDRFGSFAEAVTAPRHLLAEVAGPDVAEYLHALADGTQRLLHGRIRGREVLSSWSQVIDYCRAAMAFETREQFRILFLDKKNFLIADEVQQRGTVDHTPVYPREVIARALELSATAIILVHNHPSGDPTPSRADVEITKGVIDVAKRLGIDVHDYIVIGKRGHASMKSMGLI